MRIDAHQHFWTYEPNNYRWIPPDSVLARTFAPSDLKPLLDRAGLDGCIAVQARQSEAETAWLIDLAEAYPWIVGVVGWIDLNAADINDRLARSEHRKLVGYRHVVQDEQDDFLLRPSFLHGVRAVLDRNLSYDILIRSDQARDVLPFAEAVGDGHLIVDHGAKPDIARRAWYPWAKDIAAMAAIPSLFCKISGLVTEAAHDVWTEDDIGPYLDHLLASFGPGRILFGSDWPVCALAADYQRVHDLIEDFIARACPGEREAIFGGNAVQAYRLGRARP